MPNFNVDLTQLILQLIILLGVAAMLAGLVVLLVQYRRGASIERGLPFLLPIYVGGGLALIAALVGMVLAVYLWTGYGISFNFYGPVVYP